MAEYEKEFNHLRKYAPEAVLTEAFGVGNLKMDYMIPSRGT